MRKEDFSFTVEGTLAELEPHIARTMRDSTGTGTFGVFRKERDDDVLQFINAGNQVAFYFPLWTDVQRRNEAKVKTAAAKLGLEIEVVGSADSRDLRISLEAAPPRVAELMAQLLALIYNVGQSEQLKIEYFGFDAT